MVYYGNMHPGIVMIDAKPIPSSRDVLVNFSPGHGVKDHQGHATIVSAPLGPDEQSTAKRLHSGPMIKDPYPLSHDCLLVARGNQHTDHGRKRKVRESAPTEGAGPDSRASTGNAATPRAGDRTSHDNRVRHWKFVLAECLPRSESGWSRVAAR